MNYFYYRENPDGTYSLSPLYKEFGEDWKIMGSWSVLPARLLGLSWPNYLRYCMKCGADVKGKNHHYPIIHWKEKNKDFLDELNKRANYLIKVGKD